MGEIKELHQKKMKYSINLLLIFAWVLCEQELLHVEANGGFVQTRGLQFVLDGAPFFINGFNSYWLMSFGADPSHRSKVSTAFEQASMHGLNVARAWAFSDGGYSPLQYSPGSYNENMFKVALIDHIIQY